MAQTHFQNLDEESRALHESWDQIGRLVVVTGLLAVAVWAMCSALRAAVHALSEPLLHGANHHDWKGALVLLLALGLAGLLRGLLALRPGWSDATGDGMRVALANYHSTYDDPGDDPTPRYERPAFGLAAKKWVLTLLTLGSGGSGGLEAPVVLMGESLSAGVSRILAVRSEYELRTYQLAAISAAVATLLGAPFTAGLFAAEVAYGDRIIYRKLAYGLWAGVIAYILNNRLRGYAPLFVGPDHLPTYSMVEYAAAAGVAVAVSVPVALGFGRALQGTRGLRERVHPRALAVVSSISVGLVALVLYWGAGIEPKHVLGMGEETIAGLLAGDPALAGWGILSLALLGKMVTTGLTIAGGGSAGMLVPSMYLGGLSGALTAHLLNATGWVALDPALFAVVGIGSSLVAVIGVPLSAIALVLEVFGKGFGPPAVLAIGVTYLVTLKLKLYGPGQREAAAKIQP